MLFLAPQKFQRSTIGCLRNNSVSCFKLDFNTVFVTKMMAMMMMMMMI